MKKCGYPNCNNEIENQKKYCSKKCYLDNIKRTYKKTCLKCKKEFEFKNAAYMKTKMFCSYQCRFKKMDTDSTYFSDMSDPQKWITYGQIFTIGNTIDYRILTLVSDIDTINDIYSKLNCNYKCTPIKSSGKDLWTTRITNEAIVNDLVNLGISKNHLWKEVPPHDIWEGMKRTHCYKEENGTRTFTTLSSKVAKWVCDKFNGVISTNIIRNFGIQNCEYVVVF